LLIECPGITERPLFVRAREREEGESGDQENEGEMDRDRGDIGGEIKTPKRYSETGI
jgi:hypothetical protein